MNVDARALSGEALADALRDSRRRTLAFTQDLDDAQWQVPRRAGVNPIAWELAHIAWFAEFWMLRGPHRVGGDGLVHASRPAVHAGPDHWFDSARLAHAARWDVALPARDALLRMLADQLAACLEAVPADTCDEALYFHRLALLHEDMHGEAFAWLRASLGLPAPAGLALAALPEPTQLRVDGGELVIGCPASRAGFAFDNERPAMSVVLAPFEIDSHPVSNAAYMRFVESGGRAPGHWRPRGGGWEVRWFDRWQPLAPGEPVMHIDAREAEAYCRWAGRRLPTAAEWEHAAMTRHEAFHWGRGVWEWTASDFLPYEGFVAGPYKDYSAPWFGDHRELRGGAFATHARLHDARYRNFFLPDRRDVFAGFRTVAVEG